MVGANALSTSCCGDCSLLRKVPSHTHNPSPHEGRLRAQRGLRHPGHCEEHLGPRAAMDRLRGRAEGGPEHEHAGSHGLYPQVARLWASTLYPLLPAYHDAAARFPPRGQESLPWGGTSGIPAPRGNLSPRAGVSKPVD